MTRQNFDKPQTLKFHAIGRGKDHAVTQEGSTRMRNKNDWHHCDQNKLCFFFCDYKIHSLNSGRVPWTRNFELDSWQYVRVPIGYLHAFHNLQFKVQFFIRVNVRRFLLHLQPCVYIIFKKSFSALISWEMTYFVYFRNAISFLHSFRNLGCTPRNSQHTFSICMLANILALQYGFFLFTYYTCTTQGKGQYSPIMIR